MSSWAARSAPFECERWEARAPTASPAEPQGVHDVYTAPLVGEERAEALVARALAVLLRYDVFPPRRMRHHVATADGTLRAGALVIQRVIAGPLAVEAAVRVDRVFDERARGGHAGFSYTTLAGHLERGVATFSAGVDAGGAALLRVESWSRPGSALASLGRPFIRRMQRASVQEALRHVQQQVRDFASSTERATP